MTLVFRSVPVSAAVGVHRVATYVASYSMTPVDRSNRAPRRDAVRGCAERRVLPREFVTAGSSEHGDAGLRQMCWQDGVKVPTMTTRRKG